MGFFTKRCTDGGSTHNYQAAITYDSRPGFDSVKGASYDMANIMEASRIKTQTYHGHVCTWCGSVVNKPQSKP